MVTSGSFMALLKSMCGPISRVASEAIHLALEIGPHIDYASVQNDPEVTMDSRSGERIAVVYCRWNPTLTAAA